MSGKRFVRPTTDRDGNTFEVFVPRKGRNVAPAGETLWVDSYLERRILAGELEAVEILPHPETVESETTTTTGE